MPVQASLAPLIERLKPAVVNISTTTVTKHPRAPRGMPRGGRAGQRRTLRGLLRALLRPARRRRRRTELRGQSLGSGFILNAEGFILTNNHVVKDATDIQVQLSDGREFKADVVGKDPLTDVALIKLKNPPKDLPTVVLGDSDALRQGDFVLALGSPLGLRDTATLGIVSAKHRAGISPRRHLRRLHPDRRRHQPGQLRRPALQPARRGGRHQHRHRPARRRAGHRLRGPDRTSRSRSSRSSARRGR